MRVILILLLFTSFSVLGQNLVLNSTNNKYEYSSTLKNLQNVQTLQSKLLELGYTPTTTPNIFQSSFTHLVMGSFPVEINYYLIIKETDSVINYTFTNFKVNDQSKMLIPLEDLRSYKKKWIKNIDKKLPSLVSQL